MFPGGTRSLIGTVDGNQWRRHGTWLLAAADTTLEGSGRDLEASGRGFI